MKYYSVEVYEISREMLCYVKLYEMSRKGLPLRFKNRHYEALKWGLPGNHLHPFKPASLGNRKTRGDAMRS
jgi:hypothetical protein